MARVIRALPELVRIRSFTLAARLLQQLSDFGSKQFIYLMSYTSVVNFEIICNVKEGSQKGA